MHTDLSLFYKILVLVEDQGSITLADLKPFGNVRQTLGALGRLEGLRYIERNKPDGGEPYFTLTDEGDTALANILESIPREGKTWDGKWRMILFDVPETKRTVRQLYRLKLLEYGARMLQSSVWITPELGVVTRFREAIAHTEFADAVYYLEADMLPGGQMNIRELWNLDKVEDEYKMLFQAFKQQVIRASKADNRTYLAKCMMVQLALTMRKDPQLPADLMPRKWIGLEAITWYGKLRALCQ